MDYISKTQKKKDATALQKLGERLVKLPEELLEEIEMPEELREAVISARKIRSHIARKRQLQYIGTLMRQIDPQSIQDAIDDIDQGSRKKASAFKEIELWREELMGGNRELIEELLERYPEADRQQLTQLVRNAVKEREKNKPPKAFRALFRYLKNIRNNSTN